MVGMAFNHDQFIGSANYQNLDGLLDWYIAAAQAKLATLEKLARHSPAQARALFQRDPVMRKIYRITNKLDRFKGLARAEE